MEHMVLLSRTKPQRVAPFPIVGTLVCKTVGESKRKPSIQDPRAIMPPLFALTEHHSISPHHLETTTEDLELSQNQIKKKRNKKNKFQSLKLMNSAQVQDTDIVLLGSRILETLAL